MLKLKRYMKPYALLALLCIIFLFGEAMVELALPNYMSDIVNTGLQKGGIKDSVPDVIDSHMASLLEIFMTEEQKALFENSYVRYSDLDYADQQRISDKYPNVDRENTWILGDISHSDREKLDEFLCKDFYGIYYIVTKDMALENAAQGSNQFDMTLIGQKLAGITESDISEAVQEAEIAESTTKESVASLFIKSGYAALGADTDSIQNLYILKVGGQMVLLTIVSVALAISVGFMAGRVGAGVARDLRKDIFAKVIDFSPADINKFSVASLITRSTNDISQIQMMVTMGLRMLCFAPVMGIGGIIMALQKSVSLSWIVALSVIVLLGLVFVVFGLAIPKFKRMQSLVDRLNLVMRENLSGMLVIRAFGTQKFEEKRFDRANRDHTDNNLFVNRLISVMMPAMQLIMQLSMIMIIWFGAKEISRSTMQVGDMMAFMQYSMEIIMSFLFVSMIFMNIPRASVSAVRINDVLTTENSITDIENPKKLPEKPKGEIEFRNVSFKYPGAETETLENISFTAESGKTTAFIGSTGSGKTSLVSLVPRFFDVTSGEILFDGINIKELSRKQLRDNIGFVPQKSMLFSGDIMSNMTFGKEDATEEDVMAAIDTAQGRGIIEEKDGGIHAAISQGGTNVSGGQRQRLSIARALVKKPPVYIFDDTFSALDFKTDAALRKALAGYTGGATVLLVAQRISPRMNADKIIVLNDGQIVGEGSHKDLLRTCPTYLEIAQSQLSKEELEA